MTADYAMKCLDALGLTQVDVLGFSRGGIVAQLIAKRRLSLPRRIVLAGACEEIPAALFAHLGEPLAHAA